MEAYWVAFLLCGKKIVILFGPHLRRQVGHKYKKKIEKINFREALGQPLKMVHLHFWGQWLTPSFACTKFKIQFLTLKKFQALLCCEIHCLRHWIVASQNRQYKYVTQ